MRRSLWIILPLLAVILAPTAAWEASVSQNLSITITAATQSVSLTPASLTFGSQNIGTSSPPQTVTMTNTGSVSFPLSSVATTGTNASDFSETNNCPSSLAVSAGCQISVTFTPTATGTRTASLVVLTTGGGTYTVSLSGTGVTPTVSAFYVATNGSDSNPGTVTAPFATLGKCQAAMRGSSTKTCYIRAGTYAPGSGYTTVTNSGVTSALYLTSSDDGETWAYYLPDGVNSPVISMGGTNTPGTCTGIDYGFWIDGGSNITINGLTFNNGGLTAIAVHGGNSFIGVGIGLFPLTVGSASNNTISNNIITGMHGTSSCYNLKFAGSTCTAPCGTGPRAAINAEVQVPNLTVTHNVVHDVDAPGMATVAQSDDVSGANVVGQVYSYNAVFNTCLIENDCGGIGGFYDPGVTCQTGCYTIKDNYVRDAAPNDGAHLNSQWVYFDDGTSGVTLSGNVLTGFASNGNQLHGGKNIVVTGNIYDIGGYPQVQSFNNWANIWVPDNTTNMSGNVWTNNIIVQNSTANTGMWEMNTGTCPGGCSSLADTNNLYYNYGGGGSTTNQDKSPTVADPSLSCWTYNLASSSPAYSPPVSFPTQPSNWGQAGFWGPPGYTIPHSGNPPSSPHSC
jgi:hypothetical protein